MRCFINSVPKLKFTNLHRKEIQDVRLRPDRKDLLVLENWETSKLAAAVRLCLKHKRIIVNSHGAFSLTIREQASRASIWESCQRSVLFISSLSPSRVLSWRWLADHGSGGSTGAGSTDSPGLRRTRLKPSAQILCTLGNKEFGLGLEDTIPVAGTDFLDSNNWRNNI